MNWTADMHVGLDAAIDGNRWAIGRIASTNAQRLPSPLRMTLLNRRWTAPLPDPAGNP